jgi:hypothetical protein
MDYYQKYLKYKFKYTTFKSQYGGECKLKTGFLFSKKDRPLCQILVDKECNDGIFRLTLDQKKEMLKNNCPPTIPELTQWYSNDKKKVVAFDILGFPETNQLYTTQQYIDAGYTLEDVLESLLLKYAKDPETYDELFFKVKELIEGLPFISNNYGNFILFIKNLIENKSKFTDDKYKKLMEAIKKKLTKTKTDSTDEVTTQLMLFIQQINTDTASTSSTGSTDKLMSPIEIGIIQALFKDLPPNFPEIYDEIEKELFKINLTFLNGQTMNVIVEYPRVFAFFYEKFKLTPQQIKKLFCIIYKYNCEMYFLNFFKKNFPDKIKTKADIDLLLLLDNPTDPKDDKYYNRLINYFPEKALEFSEELGITFINFIISKFASSFSNYADVIIKILTKKLLNLLKEKKYVEFFELLIKQQPILNENFFNKKIKNDNDHYDHSKEYMKAIIQKFLIDSADVEKHVAIKRQLAILMIAASHYGFYITDEVKQLIIDLKKEIKLTDGDLFSMQIYIFDKEYEFFFKNDDDNDNIKLKDLSRQFKTFYNTYKTTTVPGKDRQRIDKIVPKILFWAKDL